MSEVFRVVRGYRPGRQSAEGPDLSGRESVRLANLERYVLRAQAGLPIFDDADASMRALALNRRASVM